MGRVWAVMLVIMGLLTSGCMAEDTPTAGDEPTQGKTWQFWFVTGASCLSPLERVVPLNWTAPDNDHGVWEGAEPFDVPEHAAVLHITASEVSVFYPYHNVSIVDPEGAVVVTFDTADLWLNAGSAKFFVEGPSSGRYTLDWRIVGGGPSVSVLIEAFVCHPKATNDPAARGSF